MAEELRWAGGLDTEAVDRAGARADAPRRAALPHPQARCRDRLSRVQPARRDHHVALRHRIADRPLERGGRALCRRHAGSQGTGHRCQRRSRGHGHAASIRRSASRGGAAGRGAGRHRADVAHRAGAARRSVSIAGRHRPARGGGPVAAADGRRRRTRRTRRTTRAAYELYLRANELARTYEGVVQARDLYERCLDLDPAFAPAWAHLGRCHRVIAKFIDASSDETRAQAALDRAIALNPRLSVAHKYYAQLEADMGQVDERDGPPARTGGTARQRSRSSSPDSSTPAATAGCSSRPSMRTPRRAGSIRTCRRASSRRSC